MSAISSNPAALNLTGSIVGATPPHSAVDRNKAASAEQKTANDRETALSQTLGDISDAGLESERDADGRMSYQRSPSSNRSPEGDAQNATSAASKHSEDAFGDRGNSLDVDA